MVTLTGLATSFYHYFYLYYIVGTRIYIIIYTMRSAAAVASIAVHAVYT